MHTITMTRMESRTENKAFLSSIITGQIAGLIMAVAVMAVFAIVYGKSPFFPLQVIGSVIMGENALDGINFMAVLVGLILHQAGPSLLWGVVFGFIARKFNLTSPRYALFAGFILAIISMLGPYLFIPSIFNALQGVDIWNREVPIFWDWVAHLIFGLSFVFYPMFLKNFKKRNIYYELYLSL